MVTYRRLGILGKWGNQLFQYAGTRLYAELNGFTHAFPRWQGNKVFQNIRHYTAYEYALSRILPTCQLNDLIANTRIERLRHILYGYRLPHTIPLANLYAHPRDNINLYGYFQERMGIDMLLRHKEQIRRWFTVTKNIDEAVQRETRKLGPYVGVHIRRGDWIRIGIAPPIEPFKEYITRLRGTRPVVVCSDSEEVLHTFKPLGITCVSNPLPSLDPVIFDFLLLRDAATVIGSGSTFSWWAAYLGNRNDYYAPTNHAWDIEKGLSLRKHAV